MTESMRHTLCLITAGIGALLALAALDVTTGPRLGIADHETLGSLTRRLVLWPAAAWLAFVALRPLRPTPGRDR
jgi:hypothetical protein